MPRAAVTFGGNEILMLFLPTPFADCPNATNPCMKQLDEIFDVRFQHLATWSVTIRCQDGCVGRPSTPRANHVSKHKSRTHCRIRSMTNASRQRTTEPHQNVTLHGFTCCDMSHMYDIPLPSPPCSAVSVTIYAPHLTVKRMSMFAIRTLLASTSERRLWVYTRATI